MEPLSRLGSSQAWFFTAGIADHLQRKETKSGYIPVSAVVKAVAMGLDGLIDIRAMLESTASNALLVSG